MFLIHLLNGENLSQKKFKKMLYPNSIAFAIITYYPKWYKGKLKNYSQTDKIRGDLALEFIRKAISLGFQLVVADGKSSKNFKKQLKKFDIKIIKRLSPKRSPAKRQAFKVASKIIGVKVIVACEPEKISALDSVQIFTKPILENKADIVVLKREQSLFKETYPDYMYESEMEGNRLYNEQLKLNKLLKGAYEFDIFFGPKAFSNSSKILSLFTKKFSFSTNTQKSQEEYFDPEENSNALYFPIVTALQKGFRVKSVEIPFSYPKLQKLNEVIGARKFYIKKRYNHRKEALRELMYLLDYLQRQKSIVS